MNYGMVAIDLSLQSLTFLLSQTSLALFFDQRAQGKALILEFLLRVLPLPWHPSLGPYLLAISPHGNLQQ